MNTLIFAWLSASLNVLLFWLALRSWLVKMEMKAERDLANATAEAHMQEAEKSRIAIVQALSAPLHATPRPVSAPASKPRRVARTMGEWQKANELQVMPMGMREKKVDPNT